MNTQLEHVLLAMHVHGDFSDPEGTMYNQLVKVLLAIPILVSPLVGAYLGIRHRTPSTSFFIAWRSTILIGSILGAIVCLVFVVGDNVDLRLRGGVRAGNPIFSDPFPEGVYFWPFLLGETIFCGISIVTGFVSGLIAWAWSTRRSRN